MLRVMVAGLCAIAVAGVGYTAVGGRRAKSICIRCGEASTVLADVAPTAPTTAPAVVDVKNTKCLDTLEDVDGGPTTVYQGKLYHFCCESCVKKFNQNRARYVKAVEADPAKFGIR